MPDEDVVTVIDLDEPDEVLPRLTQCPTCGVFIGGECSRCPRPAGQPISPEQLAQMEREGRAW